MTRRGGGHLYQRGVVYWMKFYVDGRPVFESTKQTAEKAAQRVLNDRLGRVARGEPLLPRADRVMYADAAKDLRTHYTASGERNTEEVGYRLAHLDAFFRHHRLVQIQPALVGEYVVKRQGQGAANGTINRELVVLGRMLKLAYEHNKLMRMPILRKLKEAAPRAGFFEREQFEAVRSHLSPDLQVTALIAHTYGWRTQSEVLTLKWSQVDLTAGILRLEPGETKNDDGREVRLTAEVEIALQAQRERVAALERATGRPVPFVFPPLSGQQRSGNRRADYRKAWTSACLKAGLAEKTDKDGKTIVKPLAIRHDFGRTAVRNMVNAGVPERVAMQVTGHKTRAVFDRYHIVSPADLEAAARRLDSYNHGDSRHVGLETRPTTV